MAALMAPAATAGGLVIEGAPCGSRVHMERLLTSLGEVVVGAAVNHGGFGMTQLWSAPGGVTWTITVTTVDGVTCFLAAGRDWQPIEIVRSDRAS